MQPAVSYIMYAASSHEKTEWIGAELSANSMVAGLHKLFKFVVK